MTIRPCESRTTRPSVAVSRMALSSRASAFCVPQVGFEPGYDVFLVIAAQGEKRCGQSIPFDRLDARPYGDDVARSRSHADRLAAGSRRMFEQARHAAGGMQGVLVGKAEKIEQGAIGIDRDIVPAHQQAEAEPVEDSRRIASEITLPGLVRRVCRGNRRDVRQLAALPQPQWAHLRDQIRPSPPPTSRPPPPERRRSP